MKQPKWNIPIGIAFCALIGLLGTKAVLVLVERFGSATATPAAVLRVANWGSPWVDPDFMRLERELWGEFERRHPGCKLQIEQIPGEGQYRPKLIMQHVAGVAPDVATIDMSSGADFMNNGLLMDLRPFIEKDPEFRKGDFFDHLWSIASRDGHIYAVPLDFTPMVMIYNKKLFDAAGVPYPREGWSWDEFRDTCRKLTIREPGAVRPAQWGFYFENEMPLWLPWLWSGGGDVLSPDGGRARGYFDGSASVEAIQFLADLMLVDQTASHPRDRAALGVNFFLKSRAAMDLRGHWMLIDYRAAGLDIGVATIPTNTGQPTTVLYVSGLSIMKQSRHPELAWEYIKYATSTAVQVKRVASGLAISGNRRAAEHYMGNPVEDAFIRALDFARPAWGATVENYAVCQDLGKEAMESILFSGVPVEEALSKAAGMMDAALFTGEEEP